MDNVIDMQKVREKAEQDKVNDVESFFNECLGVQKDGWLTRRGPADGVIVIAVRHDKEGMHYEQYHTGCSKTDRLAIYELLKHQEIEDILYGDS